MASSQLPHEGYLREREVLCGSRERVLAVADLVVPGHGDPFVPSADTSR